MLTSYVKLALKVLRRRKFFTFISLFGISLTLVVLMLATAILDNLFAPRKPESRLDRMLCVYILKLKGPEAERTSTPSYSFLDRYMRGLPGAEATTIFSQLQTAVMYHRGEKIETHVKRTDATYWKVLDFRFLEGGPYTAADDRNANFVAVINETMRRKLYGGQQAVGKTFELDGRTYRVVGVVPAVAFTRQAAFSEIWAPISTTPGDAWRRQVSGGFLGVVLAKSTADIPRLRAAFKERLDHYVFDDPKMFNHVEAGLDTTFEAIVRLMSPGGDVQGSGGMRMRLGLAAIALLFVTLPTLNLVSINLSRILERSSEIGVRKAFGASSRTLIGQFVVENVVLTVLGGLLAFLLSMAALALLNRAQLVPYLEFDLNFRIFAWGIALAGLFGVISGVYPAWRMSRMHPVHALRGGAQ
jgi:putative ABC transport system permease protein